MGLLPVQSLSPLPWRHRSRLRQGGVKLKYSLPRTFDSSPNSKCVLSTGSQNCQQSYGGILWWGDAKTTATIDTALAKRTGAILPLITGQPDEAHALEERHICIDTTASGGNAALLGEVS